MNFNKAINNSSPENVKLLMTRFIMENKDPEETEVLKEQIKNGIKENQNDAEAIIKIKMAMASFLALSGMPGLENKMSELRKIIDNATSKDEIDM